MGSHWVGPVRWAHTGDGTHSLRLEEKMKQKRMERQEKEKKVQEMEVIALFSNVM